MRHQQDYVEQYAQAHSGAETMVNGAANRLTDDDPETAAVLAATAQAQATLALAAATMAAVANEPDELDED